jgi:hypothetical protein
MATALDALAAIAGKPTLNMAGKVISVAPPANALIKPPVIPAENRKVIVDRVIAPPEKTKRMQQHTYVVWNVCDLHYLREYPAGVVPKVRRNSLPK